MGAHLDFSNARTANLYGMREGPAQYAGGTWLEAESMAYPHGGLTRRGVAELRLNRHRPDMCEANGYRKGELKRVLAGIPDSFSTIPATINLKRRRVRGYLSMCRRDESGEYVLTFTPEAGDGEHDMRDTCTHPDGDDI